MDEFFHVRMLIGIILGLSIAQLLKGVAKFIQHPGRDKVYVLHLTWVFYTFLVIIHFWWWEFNLRSIHAWTFPMYFFILIYATTYYLSASLLFPDDLKDYSGFKDYFQSRKKWFFGVVALTYLLDVCDSLLKGSTMLEHLGIIYYISIALHISICGLAIKIENEKFQYAIVAIFILYQLVFIYNDYLFLNVNR